jgi:CBS domain containing-hemolysin-like protein
VHESIPEVGEEIEIENFHIKILKASNKRIDLVELSKQSEKEKNE